MQTMQEVNINTAAICSWSGGKDSCLAYYKAKMAGCDIRYLLNFISRESKRGCFHGIENCLLQLQAELIGVPLVHQEVSPDMKLYEQEFKSAVKAFKLKGINAMVFGDIYLIDHASWVERVCKEIEIIPLEPLWNKNPVAVLEEFIDLGFKAIIVSCQADKLDESFIGRELDKKLLQELRSKHICPCGENGEFHTFVVDGPVFKHGIDIKKSEIVLKEGFWKHWFLDIKQYGIK